MKPKKVQAPIMPYHDDNYIKPAEFNKLLNHMMLGEYDMLEYTLEHLRHQYHTDSQPEECELFEDRIVELMNHAEEDGILNAELLGVLSKMPFNSHEFCVGTLKIIAKRFLGNNVEGFNELTDWFFDHLDNYRYANHNYVLKSIYIEHINYTLKQTLGDEKRLLDFTSKIPLTIQELVFLSTTSSIDKATLVESLHTEKGLQMVHDTSVIDTIRSFARSNPSNPNAYIADFGLYLDAASKLSNEGFEHEAASLVEQAIQSPMVMNSTFNLGLFNAYFLIHNRNTTAFIDMLVRNEDRLIEIINTLSTVDEQNKRAIQILSIPALTRLGAAPNAGLSTTARDLAELLAEAGATKLAKLITLNSKEIINDNQFLERMEQNLGAFTADDLVSIYESSCANVSSSLQDAVITDIKPFLEYAQRHDLEVPWKTAGLGEGLSIKSIAKQINQIKQGVDEAKEQGRDVDWWITQMSNAILSIPTSRYSFDEILEIVEDAIGKKNLQNVNIYKRHTLAQDLGL